jgi:hypothetical protein
VKENLMKGKAAAVVLQNVRMTGTESGCQKWVKMKLRI